MAAGGVIACNRGNAVPQFGNRYITPGICFLNILIHDPIHPLPRLFKLAQMSMFISIAQTMIVSGWIKLLEYSTIGVVSGPLIKLAPINGCACTTHPA